MSEETPESVSPASNSPTSNSAAAAANIDVVIQREFAGPSKARYRWVVSTLILVFACSNYWVVDAFNEGPDNTIAVLRMGLLIGAVVGQVNLISIWAAMAPGRIVERIPWATMLTILMWYSIVAGNDYADERYAAAGTMQLGMVLIASQLIAQTPLWIGSQVFGWRLRWQDESDSGAGQFSVIDMMRGTSLLALALALCRFVIPSEAFTWDHIALEWPLMFIVGVMVVVDLVVVIPCIWAAFQPYQRFRAIVPVGAALIVGITFLEFMALCAALGPPGSEYWEMIVLGVVVNATQCVVVGGVLLLLRWSGFRLANQRRVLG